MTYGVKEVEEKLRSANVETVLVSEDISLTRLRLICKHCKREAVKVVGRDKYIEEKQKMLAANCEQCGSPDQALEEKDFIEHLADIAVDSAAKVEVISSKTEEGNMLKSFGGVAAILRFRQR
jgi:peptide chain release factor subunit 1